MKNYFDSNLFRLTKSTRLYAGIGLIAFSWLVIEHLGEKIGALLYVLVN